MITLSHGSGGKATRDLIEKFIAPLFKLRNYNAVGLDAFDDGSAVRIGNRYIVLTSDSYTVDPIFFKGGDIGKLAACGTINDLSVMGAEPIAMHSNIIVEEGFEKRSLKRILRSMSSVMGREKVHLLGGDTKVLERGKADKLIIAAFGIGIATKLILDSGLRQGDRLIVSGTIGEHEMAIFSEREKLDFTGKFKSDCAPIHRMLLKARSAGRISSMKDITRGGLAEALTEMASKSNATIIIKEEDIPVSKGVMNACEIFGFDPLNLACEGRAILGVSKGSAGKVLRALQSTGHGRGSRIIGHVAGKGGEVIMETPFGGRRLLQVPTGSLLPRIC